MIISCLRGGLNLDFSKCYPLGSDIGFIVNENVELRFYNIYNCQTESNLNFEKLLINQKPIGLDENSLMNRKTFLKIHKKAIIQRFKTGMIDSIFFDSIQQETLNNIFTQTKLSCRVDIVYKNKKISLGKLRKTNTKSYKEVCKYLFALKVCEIITIEEYEKYSNNNFMKLDIKSFGYGVLTATAMISAAIFIIKEGV